MIPKKIYKLEEVEDIVTSQLNYNLNEVESENSLCSQYLSHEWSRTQWSICLELGMYIVYYREPRFLLQT